MTSILTGYRWLWIGWFGIFLGLEFTAIFRGRTRDTLSAFVWQLCDVTPGKTTWNWNIIHFLVAAFLIWLFVHMVFGWLYRL